MVVIGVGGIVTYLSDGLLEPGAWLFGEGTAAAGATDAALSGAASKLAETYVERSMDGEEGMSFWDGVRAARNGAITGMAAKSLMLSNGASSKGLEFGLGEGLGAGIDSIFRH
jgi:hypothetical protein